MKKNTTSKKNIDSRKKVPMQKNYFTKAKAFTYLMMFLCPPYALYRIWKKHQDMDRDDRFVLTLTTLVYCYVLIAFVVESIKR